MTLMSVKLISIVKGKNDELTKKLEKFLKILKNPKSIKYLEYFNINEFRYETSGSSNAYVLVYSKKKLIYDKEYVKN